MRDIEFAHIAVIVGILCICATAINGCNQTEQTQRIQRITYAETVQKALELGQDPLAAGCAFGTGGNSQSASEGNTAICIANGVRK